MTVRPEFALSSIGKVFRWALCLRLYNYTCSHIAGMDNVSADHFTRSAPPSSVRSDIKIATPPTTPSDVSVSPGNENIQEGQQFYSSSRAPNAHIMDGVWRTKGDLIWSTDDEDVLWLRWCIIAPSGAAGHWGSHVSATVLIETFYWKHLLQICKRSIKHASIAFQRHVGNGCDVRWD